VGKSKDSLFSEFHNKMATFAKALAHPARIAILETLIRKGTCVCGDLVEELPLSQATVSQHLKAMKEAGLLKGTVDGPYRCYCLDTENCARLLDFLKSSFSKVGCC